MVFRPLLLRLRYRHGFPLITSVVLAVLTAAFPRIREAVFHQGTSIWTFAIFVTVSTAFALLCGGRFRTFFITVAVTPPLLFAMPRFLRSQTSHPDYPIRGFVEYFAYFVAGPIIFTWLAAKLLNRRDPGA